MKYGILISLGLAATLLLLIGCAQQPQTRYQCQDGTTVYDLSMCPNQQTPQEEPAQERQCELSTQETGTSMGQAICCDDGLGMADCIIPGKKCENIAVPTRVITETIECVNNQCNPPETTIVKDCKDYGSDWRCGMEGPLADNKPYCTDMSELVYI